MTQPHSRPLWLSVPAAALESGSSCPSWCWSMAQARALSFAADHGVAGSSPSTGWVASPGPAEGVIPAEPWLEDQPACDWGPALDAYKARLDSVHLDLGRQDSRRIEPSAQRFDLAPGTADSRLSAAMDRHQLDVALSAGRHAVERAKLAGVGLIWAHGAGAGAAMTNAVWERWLYGFAERLDEGASERALDAVPGTRARCRLRRSAASEIVRIGGKGDGALAILRRHGQALTDPYEALRCFGGFEHAALVGSALAAAQVGLRWLALGASAQAALRLAVRLNPSVARWLEAAPCCSGRRITHEIVLGRAVGWPASGLAR